MVQRIYRHDLRCPHCGSNWLPKDGCSGGNQTHRCGAIDTTASPWEATVVITGSRSSR